MVGSGPQLEWKVKMPPETQKALKLALEQILSEHAMTVGHLEISTGIPFKKSILDEDGNDAVFITLMAIKKPI